MQLVAWQHCSCTQSLSVVQLLVSTLPSIVVTVEVVGSSPVNVTVTVLKMGWGKGE
jgi:hypothetical protein